MAVPTWLTFSCAVMVIVWGLYRIRLGLRSDLEQQRAPKGLFAMARRTHLLIGLVYVLLGGGLFAIGLGWNPLTQQEVKRETTQPKPLPEGQLIEIGPGSSE